jgi:hypothetical protein
MGRIGFGWLRILSDGGLCEDGNESLGSIKAAALQRISCTM